MIHKRLNIEKTSAIFFKSKGWFEDVKYKHKIDTERLKEDS